MRTTAVSLRESLKLGGAGLAGAALLGTAGCGEGGHKAIDWQANADLLHGAEH